MQHGITWLKRPAMVLVALLLAGIAVLSACSNSSSGANVTITLSAPNQFTTSGSDFGPAWTTILAKYHSLHPNVTVKLNVLPLSSFSQTLSTQLSAGTASDIVFNQATYKSFMVTPLDSYLNKPNPYAPGKGNWIDLFDPNGFNFTNGQSLNDGHLYWVPLNLVSIGLFVNEDLFTKAGVTFPIQTWADWQAAVAKFKAAGITPLAMDNSTIGIDWPVGTMFNMLLTKYYDQWNWFDAKGNPGTNPTLTGKDLVRAIKQGKLTAELPEVAETLQLAKSDVYNAATPNWSGVKGLSGAGVNLDDFVAGKAAMAWAVNLGASDIANVPFKVGSMPSPTITTATTPLSTNQPAQFGVVAGGTSYMIPSTTKGDQLKWAVDFLQYMTAPSADTQAWVTGTQSIPSIQGVTASDSLKGFYQGDWGTSPKSSGYSLVGLSSQEGTDFPQIIQGYLLGTTNLAATEKKLDAAWQAAAVQNIKDNNWGGEDWAK